MGFLLSLIFLVLFITGVVNYEYYKRKEKEYYKAKGTIIGYREFQDRGRRGGELSLYYYPIVEYRNKNGDIQQIESEDCSIDAPMYPVGTEIDLLVNPNDNTRILFDTKTDKILVPLTCVSIGAIGLILIICFYIFSPSNHPNQGIEIITKDSTFNQLPENVKDSVLSIIKNH
jgi:Protein of unknown function (DUF3592)